MAPAGASWATRLLVAPARRRQRRRGARHRRPTRRPIRTRSTRTTFPEESNVYGLTIAPNGDALVADAAGNDIVRVTPDGDAWTVARFDLEAVVDRPPAAPSSSLPPDDHAEARADDRDVGPDGDIYVGELKGFPFRPGSSNVWRIDADAGDAWCSVNDSELGVQPCTPRADGDPGHRLQRRTAAALRARAGRRRRARLRGRLETGEFRGAVLPGAAREAGPGSSPPASCPSPVESPSTSSGNIYVTDGVFTGGRLVRIGQVRRARSGRESRQLLAGSRPDGSWQGSAQTPSAGRRGVRAHCDTPRASWPAWSSCSYLLVGAALVAAALGGYVLARRHIEDAPAPTIDETVADAARGGDGADVTIAPPPTVTQRSASRSSRPPCCCARAARRGCLHA